MPLQLTLAAYACTQVHVTAHSHADTSTHTYAPMPYTPQKNT